MISKELLRQVVGFCDCYTDGDEDIQSPCSFAPECVYKAECDEIRYTYGYKPFAIDNTLIERTDTDNVTNDD